MRAEKYFEIISRFPCYALAHYAEVHYTSGVATMNATKGKEDDEPNPEGWN
jgi:hypothetical protein